MSEQKNQFMRVVTQDGNILDDIPSFFTVGDIDQLLFAKYKTHYTFYHLGKGLLKKDKVKMQDDEDFILALLIAQTPKAPKLNVNSEKEVRKYLQHTKVELTEMKDQNQGGENDNEIDRLVFHNGLTMKFEFMQEQSDDVSIKTKRKIAKKFIKEYVEDEEYDGKILPLGEKEARIISKNATVVLESLFNIIDQAKN